MSDRKAEYDFLRQSTGEDASPLPVTKKVLPSRTIYSNPDSFTRVSMNKTSDF
jgi:hypothetical protein